MYCPPFCSLLGSSGAGKKIRPRRNNISESGEFFWHAILERGFRGILFSQIMKKGIDFYRIVFVRMPIEAEVQHRRRSGLQEPLVKSLKGNSGVLVGRGQGKNALDFRKRSQDLRLPMASLGSRIIPQTLICPLYQIFHMAFEKPRLSQGGGQREKFLFPIFQDFPDFLRSRKVLVRIISPKEP